MKPFLLLLLLLPFCAKAQISGSGFDSTTFTFSGTDSLTHYLPGDSVYLSYFALYSVPAVTIDTAYSTLWQIGKTLKPVFSTGTVVPGIMTDTVAPYPKNSNDYFLLKLGNVVPNLVVDFWHKYQIDSLHAGGMVEFSLDTGLTWLNVVDCPTIKTENFYSDTDIVIAGQQAFTGMSNGEQLSRLQFVNCVFISVRQTATSCYFDSYEVGSSNNIPLYLRFRFVSDSAIDSLSGWMIDSIRVVSDSCIYIPGWGVPQVGTVNAISLYPNPAQNELTIESGSEAISEVMITNLLGQSQYQKVPTVNCKLLTIDVADFPPGMYLVRINGTEVRKFMKE